MKAYLMLLDGSVFEGTAHGDFKETVCEIAYNTAMAGYVEALTDPANMGQGMLMSYPLIGGAGICKEDFESDSVKAAALLVHELCSAPSNFRSEGTLEELLKEYGVPCISDLDTRAIVRHLGREGAMKGILTADISDKEALLKKLQETEVKPSLSEASLKEVTVFGAENQGANVAFFDFGSQKSVIEQFTERDCKVTVYPADTKADEILKANPEVIFLSEGPGNPNDYMAQVEEVKALKESGISMLAVGLGHELLALAQGAKVEKMHTGHHGSNYPITVPHLGKAFLTVQNHSYAVSEENLPESIEITAHNVNDGSVEAMRIKNKPIISVQFHPAAKVGPQSTDFIYDEILDLAKEAK